METDRTTHQVSEFCSVRSTSFGTNEVPLADPAPEAQPVCVAQTGYGACPLSVPIHITAFLFSGIKPQPLNTTALGWVR